MPKFTIAVLIVGAAGWVFSIAFWTTADAGFGATPSQLPQTRALAPASSTLGGDRAPIGGTDSAPRTAQSPRWKTPASASELQEFVAWMRSLPEAELRDMSNADFKFRESELVEMLRSLQGEWVLPELGDLAIDERQPLVKAVLVMGLLGAPDEERSADPRIVARCETLLGQMSKANDDPFDVGYKIITRLNDICFAQSIDYIARVSTLLADSDNSRLLIHGYFKMSARGAGRTILTEVLTGHSSRDGRMGALEALRYAARQGEFCEYEAAQVFVPALEVESDRRNRSLLLEALAATGGVAGRAVVVDIASNLEHPLCGEALEHLARDTDGAESFALAERVVTTAGVEPEVFSGACRALALLDERAATDRLAALARQTTLGPEFRIESIRALGSVRSDPTVQVHLSELLRTGDCSEVRVEALRALAATAADQIGDLRALATSDGDAQVRAEAIRHAAFSELPGASTWLAERARSDSELAVRHAALEALAERAHLGDRSVDALAEIRNVLSATDDEQESSWLTALLARAETGDSRNAHFGLDRRAKVLRYAASRLDAAGAAELVRAAAQVERKFRSVEAAARD